MFLVIAFILGYFVYGQSFAGGLSTVLLAFLTEIAAFVGLIPVAGPILYYVFAGPWIQSWTLGFTQLQGTWVSQLIFWLGLGFSIVISSIATWTVYQLAKNR
ncbi:MAG: hypothetical protein KGI38_11880 [Thaumarchaeota archaeon]|nr:hypothetical protein [Nitrososphaerota archaeon]